MTVFRDKYWLLVLWSTLGLVLDQVTKAMIIAHFPHGGNIAIIPGFFDLFHTHNDAAAFGLFGGNPVKFFLIVNVLAIGFIIYYFSRLRRDELLLASALALILGGALGNVLDRVRHGFVIDFLRFYLGKFSWPTFNVADICIVCGVCLFAFDMLRTERRLRAEKRSQ